jgi:hypothetical protein
MSKVYLKLSKAMHQQGQKRQKWKIWQKWKASKQDTEDTQDNTKWCWLYDRNTDLDFPERSVEQKLSTPGTLFIPRLSIKLHLTVWNNFYSYTNASSDKVKQVKEIYGQDESKKMKKEVQ